MEEKRAGTAAGHWAGEALRDSHHPEGVKSRIVGLKAELLVLKAELLGLFVFFFIVSLLSSVIQISSQWAQHTDRES